MKFDVLSVLNLVGQLGGDHKGAAEILSGRAEVDPDEDHALLERFGIDPARLGSGGYRAQLDAQRTPAFGGYLPGSDPRSQIVRFNLEPGFAPEEGAGYQGRGRPSPSSEPAAVVPAQRAGASPSQKARPIVVVTGASAGVGRATAVAFAERGFDVALLARGRAGLEAAALEVESKGVRALPLRTDVAEYAQVEEAARMVEERWGPIDVWVNDAMTTVFTPATSIEPEDFKRAMDVTFLGQVWGTKVALSTMVPRDAGTIVNVGSALSFMGIPLQSAYCAAKFACRGFFESTRAELLHEGSKVRMSMVHLPAVNTPQFDWCKTDMPRHPQPVPPIYEPEVCARFIVEAALDGRRSKVIGSWNKLLVIGASLAPGFANQFASRAAWDSQLTQEPVSADRPVNLWAPADDRSDAGARGIFKKKAGGFFDPSFLRTLPSTAVTFGQALVATVAEKRGYRRQATTATLVTTAANAGRAASHAIP